MKKIVTLIATLSDAKRVDKLTGNGYLQGRFAATGPIIGGPGLTWMPIVNHYASDKDGVSYFRKEGYFIAKTVADLVHRYEGIEETGKYMELKQLPNSDTLYNLRLVGSRTNLGSWTVGGLKKLRDDLKDFIDEIS